MTGKKKRTIILAIAAVLLALVVWTVWGNTALELNTYTVGSKELPDAFDGYRIAHVSDLHNAEMGDGNEKLLAVLREADPDIIAITGDLIDSRNTNIEVALAFAEKAMKIAPCYYVTGNHEARVSECAELKAGLPFSPHVTAFLSQGFMPTFIFGLPAVAYAIYRTARPENRPVIKGLLLSGVLVSVVTGISEPIEFLFLFIAPVLYAFHIVMSGLALMVMALLGVTIGNTDGGILDLLIFGVMQGMSTKWYLLFPVGIAWFAIYFFVFRWYILRHDIKTPGREVDAQGALQAVEANTRARGKSKYDHGLILRALGGKENIESLDNCITRLRLVVKDMGLIDQQALKAAGALSVVVLDAHSVQVIIGPQVQSVKSGIEALI